MKILTFEMMDLRATRKTESHKLGSRRNLFLFKKLLKTTIEDVCKRKRSFSGKRYLFI